MKFENCDIPMVDGKEYVLYWSGGQEHEKYVVVAEFVAETPKGYVCRPGKYDWTVNISKVGSKRGLPLIYKGILTDEIKNLLSLTASYKDEIKRLYNKVDSLKDEFRKIQNNN